MGWLNKPIIVGGRTECTVSKLMGELIEASRGTTSSQTRVFPLSHLVKGNQELLRSWELYGSRNFVCYSPLNNSLHVALKCSGTLKLLLSFSNLVTSMPCNTFPPRLAGSTGQNEETGQIRIKNNCWGIREVKVFCHRVRQIKPPPSIRGLTSGYGLGSKARNTSACGYWILQEWEQCCIARQSREGAQTSFFDGINTDPCGLAWLASWRLS